MPSILDTLGSPGGQVASDLLSQGINAVSQGTQNRANRRFAEKMFQWEVDANRENWRMANEYNSPQQQMKRLTEAGLNPNLVYGNGATATGGSISSAGASSPQGQPAMFDFGSAVGKYLDAEFKQTQIDNTKQVLSNLKKDEALKQAQINKINQDIIDNVWSLGNKQKLAPYNMEALQTSIKRQLSEIAKTNESIPLLRAQIDESKGRLKTMLDNNTRQWVMQGYNINQIVAKTQETLKNVDRIGYYNKFMQPWEKEKLKSQFEQINQSIENMRTSKEGRELMNNLQRMINAGEDPRIISNALQSYLTLPARIAGNIKF